MGLSGDGRVNCARGCPSVGEWIVFAAGVKLAAASPSAPDNHFAASPDCGVRRSGIWRVGGTGGDPTVNDWIVSSATVQNTAGRVVISTPYDHLTAGPHSGVTLAPGGGLVAAGVRPTVCGWIISPAGVQVATSPNNHFAPGPHCRVKSSPSGRVDGAGSCPTVSAGIVSAAGE